ncbi:phosphotransferase family protein [Gordonia sp. DT219]|uniref:phosphotransferase family protein n=1 Tax=Gordonia sp. DT219 TaxID=3416658 RepID=UPI003CF02674
MVETAPTDDRPTGPTTPVVEAHVDPLQRSARDTSTVPTVLADWITAHEDNSRGRPGLRIDAGIDANGMSSETIMVDANWADGRAPADERWVMRMAPRPEDIPVFDTYRLDHQYKTMRTAAQATGLPIPRVRWLEPTGSVLGSPFFLMDRVEGLVPPDVMPYTFGDNWLFDASPEQQRALQDSSIELVARLHAIPDAPGTFGYLREGRPAGDSDLRSQLAWLSQWYRSSAAAIGSSPLVDHALRWLDENFPTEAAAGESVLTWGDARIGNVIYQDFMPAAILDWEMATIGPRELDVSWMIFAHQVFQELCGLAGLPGMPEFLREDDVRATYRELTGVELGDLRWFSVFAGVVWCCVFMRAGARRVHFGEIPRPADVDAELFYHRTLLERLLTEGP